MSLAFKVMTKNLGKIDKRNLNERSREQASIISLFLLSFFTHFRWLMGSLSPCWANLSVLALLCYSSRSRIFLFFFSPMGDQLSATKKVTVIQLSISQLYVCSLARLLGDERGILSDDHHVLAHKTKGLMSPFNTISTPVPYAQVLPRNSD